MKSDDSGTITPADIEGKLKDFKSELLSISGGFSVLQKVGPSAMTLLGMLLRGNTKRKRKGQKTTYCPNSTISECEEIFSRFKQ